MRSSLAAIALVSVLLCSGLPFSGTALADPDRPAVVRHRLFENDGKFEASLALGFTPVTYLTRHVALDAGAAWNLTETWSIHLRGAYAFASHTQTADDASATLLSSDPSIRFRRVDDFEDLWTLRWSALAAGRWMPIYGKLSLFSALPAHFGLYLLAGVGVGGFERDSLVLADMSESAVKPLFIGAIGARLYLTRHVSLNLEVGDRIFPDSFRVEIDRLTPNDTGKDAGSPGLTHLVFVSLGLTLSF
ncbi:MAG: outer membrane beta-barrel domain-containing protein [Myxococcales bacterium]|jgi:outer membrane beta-barrel protein|nr:outer membrane beta-barrel domain-containing protein [Myxococcales bacterium]